METYKIIETGQSVILLHRGFDIVIIAFEDGTQKVLSPEEIGLKKRSRLKDAKY